MLKGSEIVLQSLLDLGVDTVFGFPGGAVIPLYDSLYDYSDNLTHILTAHEQGATHAADGYARSTGKVGVVFATSGPGATNTITAIATAFMDSVPMLVITGQVSRNYLGKDSFQEIDITTMVSPITKASFLIEDIKDLEYFIKKSYKIANSGRKGPVLIDIPKDIFLEKTDYLRIENIEEKSKNVELDKIKKFAEYINNSKRPIIYAGGGVVSSNTSFYIRKLQQKNIPVVTSLTAQGVVDYKEKLSLGHVGMHGFNKSNYACDNCDLLISLGTRFSDRVASDEIKFAKSAKIIQVDISKSELGKNKDIDFEICADLEEVLKYLHKYVEKKERREWIDEILSVEEIETNRCAYEKKLFELLREYTDSDTIVCTDVGQHQMWTSQFYGFSEPRKFITSAGLGTMGFGLGSAIGSKVGNVDKEVVLITGDGSFRMNLNELATVSKYNFKILIIVMNNHALGMVRQWQEIFQNKRYSQTIITDDLDFTKLAHSFNLEGLKARNLEEFKNCLEIYKKSDKSMIIDVLIDFEDNVYPMIPAGGSYSDIILN